MQTLKHWTTFNGRPNSYFRSAGIRVTLGRRGEIYMNKIGWEALGRPKAVELLFDKGRGVIGLRGVEAWQENSFPVRDKGETAGKLIHANTFFKHFAIKPTRSFVFNQAHIDDDGILSLPLESITAISGSK